MMAYAQTAPADWPVPSPSGRAGRIRHLRLVLMDASAQWNELLLAVARAQDRRAFEALFAHFAPRIKAYLMRLGAGAAQAEDLAQEAMLSVWRKARLFDPAKASAATWVFTIARNLRIDALRRERRPEFDSNDPAFTPDDGPAADAQLVRADEDAKLRDALRRLSPDQALVIEKSFFAEKSHSEIAIELGLPLGTVKSRLRLAMAHIRAALGTAL